MALCAGRKDADGGKVDARRDSQGKDREGEPSCKENWNIIQVNVDEVKRAFPKVLEAFGLSSNPDLGASDWPGSAGETSLMRSRPCVFRV